MSMIVEPLDDKKIDRPPHSMTFKQAPKGDGRRDEDGVGAVRGIPEIRIENGEVK